VGEFLHLWPLFAVLVLVLNDWVFKYSPIIPRWFSGKASDFAGLYFFPLLLTATGDLLSFGLSRLTGWRLDFSLRPWKLRLAILFTATAFSALQFSDGWAAHYEALVRLTGLESTVYQDPWDLIALPILWLSWLRGRAELRQVPLGRLAAVGHHKSFEELRMELEDCVTAGAAPDVMDELTQAWLAWREEGEEAKLAACQRDLRVS